MIGPRFDGLQTDREADLAKGEPVRCRLTTLGRVQKHPQPRGGRREQGFDQGSRAGTRRLPGTGSPVARVTWSSACVHVVVLLTTSQKLAHRIAHELEKAFGGRTTYAWLDDGCLEARWRASSTAGTRAMRSATG